MGQSCDDDRRMEQQESIFTPRGEVSSTMSCKIFSFLMVVDAVEGELCSSAPAGIKKVFLISAQKQGASALPSTRVRFPADKISGLEASQPLSCFSAEQGRSFDRSGSK